MKNDVAMVKKGTAHCANGLIEMQRHLESY